MSAVWQNNTVTEVYSLTIPLGLPIVTPDQCNGVQSWIDHAGRKA